jgi:DNA-binding FrmR family transcriptional regulator
MLMRREEVVAVRVEPEAVGGIVERLRLAESEIHDAVDALRSGRDCAGLVGRLAMVSRLLDRAGFAVVANGLHQCVTESETDLDRAAAMEQVEKLFMALG